jgi:serine/threonine protein kinase/Tol biopolymer transport system component
MHAEGGLGRIYLALDNDLNRPVALKEIKPDQAGNPDAARRFFKEAQITGQLEHPNIVPVYELGRQPGDEQPFYVMRFIHGKTLRAAIAAYHEKRRQGQADPLEWQKLLQAFVSVCQALGYAHSRGVIHRDLKPENVVLGEYGEVIVLDWGLAKLVDKPEESATPSVHITEQAQTEASQQGQVQGTPAYMAPEQAEGRLDLIDARTDIYGLGAILFEILTGRPPHEGSDLISVLVRIVQGEAPRAKAVMPDVPAALDAICATAMAKARAERYGRAPELAEDVQRYLADEPVSRYREPLPTRLRRWTRKHRSLVSGAAAFGIVLATVAIAYGLIASAQQKADEQERIAQEKEQLRQQAEQERGIAQKERSIAQEQRSEAEKQRNRADRYLYIAHMNQAHQAWEMNQVRLMLNLLKQHSPGGTDRADFRGFEWHYFWHLCHSDQFTLKGHTSYVWSVAFSPDGKRLASASNDRTVKVWDAVTGQEILSLTGHTGGVSSVAFSLDGKHLASASNDRTVKVWDAATGQEVRTLTGHTGEVYSVAFSPDGKRLASTSEDKTVKVWDAATGQEVRTLAGHTLYVSSVAFSPDSKRLASASGDKTVKVWDAATGQEVRTLAGHTSFVLSVAFSPDGKRLASASNDRTVKVWDATTGQEAFSLRGHTGEVYSVVFSPDGKRLASAGGGDLTVKVWDATTSQEARTLTGHTGEVYSVVFSPDGKHLALAFGYQSVNVWDSATGQDFLTL